MKSPHNLNVILYCSRCCTYLSVVPTVAVVFVGPWQGISSARDGPRPVAAASSATVAAQPSRPPLFSQVLEIHQFPTRPTCLSNAIYIVVYPLNNPTKQQLSRLIALFSPRPPIDPIPFLLFPLTIATLARPSIPALPPHTLPSLACPVACQSPVWTLVLLQPSLQIFTYSVPSHPSHFSRQPYFLPPRGLKSGCVSPEKLKFRKHHREISISTPCVALSCPSPHLSAWTFHIFFFSLGSCLPLCPSLLFFTLSVPDKVATFSTIYGSLPLVPSTIITNLHLPFAIYLVRCLMGFSHRRLSLPSHNIDWLTCCVDLPK